MVRTGLVSDLNPGSGSSFPFDITQVGEKVYFVANGKLWKMDTATSTPTEVVLDADSPGLLFPNTLTAAGDTLYFEARNRLWSIDGEGNIEEFLEITPPKVPLEVRVVAGEGDNQATDADKQADTVLTRQVEIGGDPIEVDLTEAVKAALARGDTRLTILVENPLGDTPVQLELASTVGEGRTGLDVTPSSPGLVADLLAADGTVIEVGKSTIDIRAIESGTYFLRVYDPTNSTTGDIPFEIEIDAPIQGYSPTRPTTATQSTVVTGTTCWSVTRRLIVSGATVVATISSLKPLNCAISMKLAGETITPTLSSERSNIPPEGPPVDAPIAITDPGLRVAIAEALGIPITESYIPGQFLIHVDGGSQRTDLSLARRCQLPRAYSCQRSGRIDRAGCSRSQYQ